jgi:PAS domain S-box-containing protein
MNGRANEPVIPVVIALVAGVTIATTLFFLESASSSIVNVQRQWVGYEKESRQRTLLLSKLHNIIGYGGLIHNFKNYILRGDVIYKEKVENDQKRLTDTISNFRDLPLSDAEAQAISRIEATFEKYSDKFDIARDEIGKGRAPGEIDALVSVDDTDALLALNELIQEVVKKSLFHSQTTEVAIDDTVTMVELGYLLIPVVFASSLLFFVLYRRSGKLQFEAVYSNNQLKAVLNAVPDGIIVSDQQGQIIRINSQFEKLSGYSRDETLRMSIEGFISRDQSNKHRQLRAKFFSNMNDQVMNNLRHITLRQKNGLMIPVDIALGTFSDNKTAYAVASIRDMTIKHEMDDMLLKAKEKAESSTKFRSEFLANMSHELRTPLNAIIGFSEALLTDNFGPIVNDKHREYLTHVHESGMYLLKIINNILDLSKIEAGKLELNNDKVDLGEKIDNCFKMLEKQAQRSEIRLNNEIKGQSIIIQADATRLKQMLLNLISNAIKFSHNNGAVMAEARILADGSCALSISDKGIGMNEQAIQTAFEPFGQIENAQHRKRDGTGLGLPLTVILAEMHGGKLVLESEEGKGTVATIYLPAERVLNADLPRA